MKVAGIPNENKNNRHAPVISLQRKPRIEWYTKAKSTDYKCYKDPADTKSAAHTLTIYHFENEGPEELLEFLERIKTVEKGQGLTNGPDRYTLMRHVLKGAPLTAFENAAAAAGNETVTNYDKCVQAVKAAVFPPKAAIRQRRALARFRKPIDWTMRRYAGRMSELNNQIPKYPAKSDGTPYAKHSEEELVSFIEDGLPNRYCAFLREHGFDVLEHTMQEFIDFVENRIEPTDVKPDVKKESAARKASSKRKASGVEKSSDKPKKWYYCKHHGVNKSHDTTDCRVLKKPKMEKPDRSSKGKKKYYSSEEVHAMMADVAEKSANVAAKKVTAAWKKRGREDQHAMESVQTVIEKLSLDKDEKSISDDESELTSE